MNKILLDSSVIIDYLRRKDKKSTILHKLAAHQNYQLAISIITHTELYSGRSVWENKLAKNVLEEILSEIEVLGLNEELSKEAGAIKAQYGIVIQDAIIAATAVSRKLPLATLNTKDFRKIRNLKLLSQAKI